MIALKWLNVLLGACCLAVFAASIPESSVFDFATGMVGSLCFFAAAWLSQQDEVEA